MSRSKLILVGQVAGAFGVRGEVRVISFTAEPSAVARYGPLLGEDGSVALTLSAPRAAKGGIIARAKEIDTKETADSLRGLKLYLHRDILPAVEDEDEFYLADLIGLEARSVEGERLGAIRAMHNFGAGDVVELDPGGGRATLFYAFSRDIFPDVRVADGWVILAPPIEDEGDGGADRAEV